MKTDTEIKFKMYLAWDDLLEMDIDALNDEAQEVYDELHADGKSAYITDIGYRLVDRRDQQLVIEVSCSVEETEEEQP